LTALVGAMLHPDARPRGDIHAIWYDLESEQFKRLEMSDPPPHWIPLNVVGDSKKLMRWLRSWPLSSERQDLEERAFEVSKALREYHAPAYIVEGADDEVLRLIFKRVNTAGVEMLEEEVFEALHGHGQSAKAACARMESLQWGALTEEDMVDALKSVTGIDPRERFRDGERVPSLPDDAMDRTEAALRRAISFLRDAAEIPHVTLLPYRLPLRILARFFAIHPNPPPRVELLLVRWVWRGALSGQHADNGDVVVDRLQKAIGPDPHLAVARPRDIEFWGPPCWFAHLLPQGPVRRAIAHLAGVDQGEAFTLLQLYGEDLGLFYTQTGARRAWRTPTTLSQRFSILISTTRWHSRLAARHDLKLLVSPPSYASPR
jgi:hypothetical protein